MLSFLLFPLLGILSFSGFPHRERPAPACSARPPADARRQILLADPTIFFNQGTYYLYGTRTTRSGFEVYTSTDLKNWTKEDKPALSKDDVYGDTRFWAPQVFKQGNTYYMAYAADEHIAIARGDSPLGPFTQTVKQPLIKGVKTIDPFVYVEGSHKYLYYVRLSDGNRIFVSELKDDFSGLRAGTTRCCLNAVDNPQTWENQAHKTWTVTEGPTVVKHRGKYYLFYSANGFRSIYYAVGYAVSDHPKGPWKKFQGNPILDKALIGKNGPGHGDFFLDRDGRYNYVFHTHFSGEKIGPRKTAVIRGEFVPDPEADKMIFDRSSFYFLETK